MLVDPGAPGPGRWWPATGGGRPEFSAALALALAVGLALGGVGPWGGRTGSAAQPAATPMLPTDPLLGPARGTAAGVLAYARKYGARRDGEVARYVGELYRLAPAVGLDPGLMAAQADLETDTWRTDYWAEALNPAGIGITFDGQDSPVWADGTAAARAHVVHLYLYAVGEIPAGHRLAPYRRLDPRYGAAVRAGYAGIARTVADLTGRWATDPDYDRKLVGRGNDLFLRHRVVATDRTANSSPAALADDKDGGTAWAATGYPAPPRAAVTFDLGTTAPLGLVRWLFAEEGHADALTVEASADGRDWRVLAEVGNAPARAWQALPVATTARYVRFRFANPGGDAVLGALAEVQFWPPTAAPLPGVPIASATPEAE